MQQQQQASHGWKKSRQQRMLQIELFRLLILSQVIVKFQVASGNL